MKVDTVNLHFERGAKALQERGTDWTSLDAFQRACCLPGEMLRSVMHGGFKDPSRVNPLLVAQADPSRLIGCLPDWLSRSGENYSTLAAAFEGASRVVSLVDEVEDGVTSVTVFYRLGEKKSFFRLKTKFFFRGGMVLFQICQ